MGKQRNSCDKEVRLLESIACMTGIPVKKLTSEYVGASNVLRDFELLGLSASENAKIQELVNVINLHHECAWLGGKEQTVLESPEQVFSYVTARFSGLEEREYLYVIFLNNANEVLRFEQISTGGFSSTLVPVELILRKSLKYRASNMIMVHNHLSFSAKESKEDVRATIRMLNAAKQVGLTLLDHIIICKGSYISMKERGHLDD